MRVSALCDAYVIGLLPDIEASRAELLREHEASRARALGIDADLSTVLLRMDENTHAAEKCRREAEALAAKVAAANGFMSSRHQEIAALKRRVADLKEQMELCDDDEARARLRRERARGLVQIEDREAELQKASAEAETARAELAAVEARGTSHKEGARALLRELDALQSQLPRPHLYLRLFEAHAAHAHCQLWLEHDKDAFTRALYAAISYVEDLHRALRAGKYRLDQNADLVGGRATASVEAVYAALVLDDRALAARLFSVIADPSLLFDQIFNVFRLWCVGLYVGGHLPELEALLRKHQYAHGLRAGYVEGFAGLLARDARRINAALKLIVRDEWPTWQDLRVIPGAGVVNLAATSLTRLARAEGLAVTSPGPTVPQILIG